MSVLPITLLGDKILRKKVGTIREVDNETVKLIKDMFDTMKNANGVGLAANQVGVNKSIFVADISAVEGYEKTKPMVVINPKIILRSKEKSSIEEGCLSIPEVRLNIERPKNITLVYYDTNMKKHELEADELLARVIQHEYDHLQGVLFIDYISDELKENIKEALEKIKKGEVETEYPIDGKRAYQLK
jgi:peptide deformylase